jgi:DMSO/TMAO reductase YedYZ heme-binding membrane subunit
MSGWRLTFVLAAALAAMSGVLFAGHGGDVEGLRLVIRATARTSLVLFLLAFTAGATVELAPGGFTRWQRRNRRYLGVSFAVSHFIHLVALIVFAQADQELFWKLTSPVNVVLGGAAYLLLAAMTVTSFDRTAAWLSARQWRLLHLIGGWYIWVSFAVGVGKRLPQGPIYWVMTALVLFAAIVRLIAMARRNRRAVALGTL